MSIATRIENMSNNINKTYNQAKALGADLTNIDKNLENLPNILESIYNNYPKTPIETGTSIILNNTAKGRINMELTPQTSQETTSGKNLLDIYEINNSNKSEIDFTTGWITVDYTNDTDVYDYANFFTKLPEEITFKANSNYVVILEIKEVKNDNNNNYMSITNNSSSFLSGTTIPNLSLNSLTNNSVYKFEFVSKENLTNVRNLLRTFVGITAGSYVKIIYRLSVLEDTTITPETFVYQSFTGGIPAPNPDYPQEIHCTTGDNVVKVVGKNLFTGWVKNQRVYNNNTGIVIANNYISTAPISIKENTNYNVSGLTNNYGNKFVAFYDKNDVNIYLSRTGAINSNNISFTTPENSYYCRIVINSAFPSTGDMDTYVNNSQIQLEQSSSATGYVKHEETTYPISLGEKEMFNINNISDGFVYDETEDKFYINRNIGKVILSENRNWTQAAFSTGQLYYRGSPISDIKNNNNEVISNYFVAKEGWSIKSPGIWADANNTIVTTQGSLGNTETVDDFKSWLSAHNTIVVYQLATATLEEIADTTLISQLRAIKNALSMQGTTHIISTATGENLPFIIKANALLKNSN